MAKLKSYMIECGNSDTGPLGMCVRVKAFSKQDAIDKGNQFLSTHEGQGIEIDELPGHVECCTIYLAPNLTIGHIVTGDTRSVE